MAKVSFIIFVTMCLVACTIALPWQYRNYPPAQNRFAGWTVTSQELLALPSQNDPANIVRVAPPANFLRSHRISRRSVPAPVRMMPSPYHHYVYLNENGMMEYLS